MDFSKKTIWILWLSHNFEMIFTSKLLEPAKQPVASSSSFDGNIMEGDNFQIMATGRINVSICNVNFTYYFNIVFYVWYYAFENKHNRIFWAFCDLGYR